MDLEAEAEANGHFSPVFHFSPVLGYKWISYHFDKIRSKCEIFSTTFTRETGPTLCLS